jgi:hypothetical protein
LLDSRVFLLAVLLPLAVQLNAVQAESDKRPTATVLTLESTLQELMQGYLRWMHRHPEATHQTQPLIPAPAQGLPNHDSEAGPGVVPLQIRMPSIDLYAPSGVSLYHGTDSEKNAAFLRALPRGIPQRNTATTDEVRPTLQEATEMFAGLKPYEAAPSVQKGYTVFALTYPDKDRCKPQNDAIQELESRAQRIGIRVIEIRLRN